MYVSKWGPLRAALGAEMIGRVVIDGAIHLILSGS